MPTPATFQTNGMPTFGGLTPGLNANGQVPNIAFLLNIISKGANYTVLASESGSVFIATAAVTFTLPAPAAGLNYYFVNKTDANMTVNANAADKMITFNDVDADGVAFSTTSEKAGAILWVVSDGTMWYANKIGGNTLTVST